jgi:hypothetical protein
LRGASHSFLFVLDAYQAFRVSHQAFTPNLLEQGDLSPDPIHPDGLDSVVPPFVSSVERAQRSVNALPFLPLSYESWLPSCQIEQACLTCPVLAKMNFSSQKTLALIYKLCDLSEHVEPYDFMVSLF